MVGNIVVISSEGVIDTLSSYIREEPIENVFVTEWRGKDLGSFLSLKIFQREFLGTIRGQLKAT